MKASRRELMRQASVLVASFALTRCKPTEVTAPPVPDASAPKPPPPSAPGKAFLPPQRATLDATVARILPTDEEPGAKEANVIEYIDREVARPEYEWLKKNLIAGTVGLDKNANRLYQKPFVKLGPSEQDEVIGQVQAASERGADFIKILVLLTLEGFVGDPAYGGNQGNVGWTFVGYGPGIHEHH
ncbi:MAG: gluconate 2-dehydrogenase subunit 3 family protein [Deltaproteobacteria bacterium]|nr:gluconate 2-dehydrogenase subunit 3 family protein [Deltaproteobacteria bacterium]